MRVPYAPVVRGEEAQDPLPALPSEAFANFNIGAVSPRVANFRLKLNSGFPYASGLSAKTPLAASGASAAVSAPLKDGAAPTVAPEKVAEIFEAVRDGDSERLGELLASGVSAAVVDEDGNTPLIIAAEGEGECVSLLLVGSALDQQNNEGETALMAATKYEDVAIVEQLLKAGANTALVNAEGEKAADMARAGGATDIIQLLEPTAAAAAPAPAPARPGSQQKQRRCSVSDTTLEGFTESHAAANAADERRGSFRQARDGGSGAPSFKKPPKREPGPPAPTDDRAAEAFDAIGDGDADKLEELLAAGMPIECVDDDGNTFLMLAAQGEGECVSALLRHSAALNTQNNEGETALMAATKYEDVAIVEQLVQAGADMFLVNDEGKAAIDLAREIGNLDVAAVLGDAPKLPELNDRSFDAARGSRRKSVSDTTLESFTESHEQANKGRGSIDKGLNGSVLAMAGDGA